MLSYKFPSHFWITGTILKLTNERRSRFICRYNQVLLYRCCRRYLLKTTLLLIKSSNISNYEACSLNTLLNSSPNRVLAIMELNSDPSIWFKHSVILDKALFHECLILWQPFALSTIHDSFTSVISDYSKPRFPKVAKFRVIEIATKGRISKNIVHGIIRNSRKLRSTGTTIIYCGLEFSADRLNVSNFAFKCLKHRIFLRRRTNI